MAFNAVFCNPATGGAKDAFTYPPWNFHIFAPDRPICPDQKFQEFSEKKGYKSHKL